MFTLEQLRLFVAIVETGSYRAAAQQCHRSQPALTYAMQKLEDQLNCQLLTKETYRPQLTDIGSSVYDKARLILKQSRNLQAFTQLVNQGVESKIRIVVDVITPLDLYAPILKHCQQRYPDSSIELLSEVLGGGMERLQRGEAEIALTGKLDNKQNWTVLPLMQVEMLPVATPEYYQQHQQNLKQVELAEHTTQIVLSDTSRYGAKYSSGVMNTGTRWMVTDVHAKKMLIMQGLGWGRLPRHSIEDELRSQSLRVIDEPHIQSSQVELSLIRTFNQPLGRIGQEIWDYFSNQAQGN